MLASTLSGIDIQTTYQDVCLETNLTSQTHRDPSTHAGPNHSPAMTECIEPTLTYAPHRLYATRSNSVPFDENHAPHRLSLACAIPGPITPVIDPSPVEDQDVDSQETRDDRCFRETPPYHAHCLSQPSVIVPGEAVESETWENMEGGNMPQRIIPAKVDHAVPCFLERVPTPLQFQLNSAANRSFVLGSPTHSASPEPYHPIHSALRFVDPAVPLLPAPLYDPSPTTCPQYPRAASGETDTVASDAQDEEEEMLVKVGERWACLICEGTAFRRRTDLRRHMRGHNGQKTSCSKCGELFSRPDAVDRHIRDSCGQKRKRGPKPGSRRRRDRRV